MLHAQGVKGIGDGQLFRLGAVAPVLHLLIQGQIQEYVRVVDKASEQLMHIFPRHGSKAYFHRIHLKQHRAVLSWSMPWGVRA